MSKEETSARTRPFSFDEIMRRRESKKSLGDNNEEPGGAGNVPGNDIVKKVSDHSESDRCRHNDSVPSGTKHASEDFLKVSSRKEEDNTCIKEGKLVRGKDKGSRDSKSKSKATPKKSINGHEGKGGKLGGRIHGNRKNDELSSEDVENESEKRHSIYLADKERYADKRRGKSVKERKYEQQNNDERYADKRRGKFEKERKYEQQNNDDDRRIHGKRKNDKWSGEDSDKESEKRHSRYLGDKDRYSDRNRGKSEKESKRKHYNEDEHRTGERDAGKKHNSGNWHNSKFSERKEKKETSQAHKRTSYDVREHGDLPLHPSKDRLGISHSDVDRKRISSNGSSSHYQRYGGSASRLGGYSPRKRKTEAAVKTPSPTKRSPEKRTVGWDCQPTGTEREVTGSVRSNLKSSIEIAPSSTLQLPGVVPVTSIAKNPVGILLNASSSQMNASIDSIQLTQATRPMRRLYVENLPASASEKAVMECLNNFLLYSGVSQPHRTQPCISCIIHKERGQALVEFLTPEDASAALSFDGRYFSGSILKVRRPKDFIEVTADALIDILRLSVRLKTMLPSMANIRTPKHYMFSLDLFRKACKPTHAVKGLHFWGSEVDHQKKEEEESKVSKDSNNFDGAISFMNIKARMCVKGKEEEESRNSA
ncbi:unnamed protein product [Ilex paraguariensis]|uniref:RRM domain-containing protein n=1 Tax=Ilex paraguariensis TaxID=185542 RepID=A0ABC8U1A8_9AQUA